MTHPVFVEHFGHFLGDHVTIVLNSYEGDFFSHLGYGLRSRNFGGLGWALWCLTHKESIHYEEGEKGGYSNASKDDRSGYVFWHAVHVRK